MLLRAVVNVTLVRFMLLLSVKLLFVCDAMALALYRQS